MDFDRYLATLLRFVESDHEKHERLKVPRIALVPAMPAEVLAMYAGSNSKSNTKGGSPEEKTGSAIASGGRG